MKMVFVPPLLTFATCAVISMACPSNAQASLINIETVLVGDAGNAAKVGYPVGGVGYNGSISYEYRIGKYEVTIEQYVVFLNSVASITAEDHLIELWASAMMVSRTGSGTGLDPFKYYALGSGKRPIGCISWFDAARFCNWLHNGATNGASTETGAYELNGATYGIIDKNDTAMWWIPSLDEWCKAAYYKAGGTNSGYWTYPTQSDDRPGNQVGGAANQANYFRDGIYSLTQNTTAPPSVEPSQDYFTDVGVFSNSPSAYGTFDQAGNVWEWTDAHFQGLVTGFIGGSWRSGESALSGASPAGTWGRHQQWSDWGFRVATVAKTQVADSDNDGVNDYREGKDGTDPNDATSFNPLSKGLVAYFPFADTPYDESGFSREVEFSGIEAHPTPSDAPLPSYEFTGDTNSFHLTSGVPVPVDNSYSWSLWFEPSTLKQRNFLVSRILGLGLDQSTPWLEVTDSGQLRFARAAGDDSAQFQLHSPEGVVQVGSWTHVAAISSSNGKRQLFVNGIAVADGLDVWYGMELPMLLIGADRFLTWHPTHGSGSNGSFQGQISEVRIYDRALSEAEIAQLYIKDVGCTDSDMNGLPDAADFLSLFSMQELSRGQTDVTTNPSAFSLFTQAQFDGNRTAGQQDVINSPMYYGLYTTDSIMDLRMGGLMIQKDGDNAVVSFQPQTTTDLSLPFTNNGTPITNTIPMPGNKGFLRISSSSASATPTPTPPVEPSN